MQTGTSLLHIPYRGTATAGGAARCTHGGRKLIQREIERWKPVIQSGRMKAD